MAKKANIWGTKEGLDDGTKKTIPVYNGSLGNYKTDPGYSASKKYTSEPTPITPVKPTYQTNSMAYPTYTPSYAQYSYGKAAPTWNWNDSGRPGEWQWDDSGRPGDFSFDEERPEYANQYQEQINQMVSDILNRPKFEYDYNKDPLYQMYAEAYASNGAQAMKDTMGQMAARTGGLASSYAGTAAQQQYNQYMNALNDKVPELQQIAYNMYMNEGNTMRNNLGMIQGLESTDYDRYMDSLGQWNTDRNLAYNQYMNEWDQYNTDRNFSYGQYQDLWDRYYNDRDFSFDQYQAALSQYNKDRDWDYGIWSDNQARQEAANKAAYNARVAAYNAEQSRVDAYNRQQDAAYQAALKAAQDQRSAQEAKYRQQNQNTYDNDPNATIQSFRNAGSDPVVTFWGKTYNLNQSGRNGLDDLIGQINNMPFSAAKKQQLMNELKKYGV